jgi:hypothetical protein
MAPFSWRVSSLLEAVYKLEVAAYKRGSIAKLTSKPVTETDALEAAAEYLSGSARLRTHNQKMTAAAMQMALMKVWAQRSYRVAMRRQSLSLPNMRSTRLRCL